MRYQGLFWKVERKQKLHKIWREHFVELHLFEFVTVPAWASTTASTATTPLLKDFPFLKTWSKSSRFAWIFKSRWIFLQLDFWRNELKFRKRKRGYSCCFYMLSSIIIKRRSREFHVVVVRWRQKMNKKVCCTCIVVVLFIKPTAFLTFLLPSPLSLPKLPNMLAKAVPSNMNSRAWDCRSFDFVFILKAHLPSCQTLCDYTFKL